MQLCAWKVFPLLISGFWSLKYYIPPWSNLVSRKTNLCDIKQSRKRSNTRTKKLPTRNDLKLINVDHVTTNAKHSDVGALLYIFEDNEAVIEMIRKGRSPTMRHVSRTPESRLIGNLTESTWTPKSKSNMLILRTNLPISWQKAISPVKSGTTFSVCSTSWTIHSLHPAFSAQPALPTPCRKGWYSKKDQEKTNRWLQNRKQCGIWYRRLSIGLQQRWSRVHVTARGHSKQKVQIWISPVQGREHGIGFSSEATWCEFELWCRETCGRNDKGSHWYKIVSPQHDDIPELCWPSSESLIERTTKLWRQHLKWPVFAMEKCAIIGYRWKLTITEYSLTTSAKVDCNIQKEKTLHLVLRLRGDDARQHVRHQWQRDHQDPEHLLHSAHEHWHMKWMCAQFSSLSCSVFVTLELHTTSRGSSFTCARHLMVITWWAYLFDLESSIPFYFLIFSFILNLLHFLLHFFHYFEGRSNPAHFAWKEMDSLDDSSQVMSPAPTTSRKLTSSPTQSPSPTHSSPSKGSSRTWSTMTPHSRICVTKHTEYMSITPSEKACLSVSRRRPCPSERGDPLESEQRDMLDQVVRS